MPVSGEEVNYLMTASSVVNTFVTGIGTILTSVTSNSTLVMIVGVMVAAGIGRLAFKTIKRFVH